MGFGNMLMEWMEKCVYSSSFSSLVNGSPTKEFEVSRGLRQEDHLSPFLFILAAEGLTRLVKDAITKGYFHSFKINDDIKFYLLQFADDTLILEEASLGLIYGVSKGF